MKRILILVAVLLVVLVSVTDVVGSGVKWWVFLTTPMNVTTKPVEFVVQPGTPTFTLAHDLKRAGFIEHPNYFVWLVRLHHATRNIKAGMYEIKPGTLPSTFLQQIIEGKVKMHAFIIINGWSFPRIQKELKKAAYLKHTLQDLDKKSFMSAFGSNASSPEGWFYPETYLYEANMTDKHILQLAYNHMKKILDEEWQTRAEGLRYKTAYEALIVASMIEKETRIDAERAKVAGVILRRLKKKMYLQIDPTVIYGLGKDFDGVLNHSELKIDTPYNTYKYKGLPPTPIAMPSQSSIHAALHPDKGDALYFVAKGDGSHVFTSNLKDHNAAVQRWRLRRKIKKILVPNRAWLFWQHPETSNVCKSPKTS